VPNQSQRQLRCADNDSDVSRVIMTMPEPYRDPPPAARWRRRSFQDPHLLACEQTGDQSTEFGYGPGLVAPHLNGEPPSDGGVYMPRAPRVDPPPTGVGQPRQHKRPKGEVRGYPGDPMGG
jgi:hypothetical protein